jgi:hypothetical protein
MKQPFKTPKKVNQNAFKMTKPEVGINLQPGGFKVRQHKRF